MNQIPEPEPTYIAYLGPRDFKVCKSLAEALDWKSQIGKGAFVYERVGQSRMIAAEEEIAALKAKIESLEDIECAECGRGFTPMPKVSTCGECVAEAERQCDGAIAERRSILAFLEVPESDTRPLDSLVLEAFAQKDNAIAELQAQLRESKMFVAEGEITALKSVNAELNKAFQKALTDLKAAEAENARLRNEYAVDECNHLDVVNENAALKAKLAEAEQQLREYKFLYNHALQCVDEVFQVCSEIPNPMLPDFLPPGSDKFAGVKLLARAYLESKAACAALRK